MGTLTTLAGFLLMISRKNLDPVLSVDILTTSLIGINALCFIYEMVVIGYVVCQEKCVKRKKKRSNTNSTKELINNGNSSKVQVQVLPTTDDKCKEVAKEQEKQTKNAKTAVGQNQVDNAEIVAAESVAASKTVPEKKSLFVTNTRSTKVMPVPGVAANTNQPKRKLKKQRSINDSRVHLREVKKEYGVESEEYKVALEDVIREKKGQQMLGSSQVKKKPSLRKSNTAVEL